MIETAQNNPFWLFRQWFQEAVEKLGDEDGRAMCLATTTPEGRPSARILLLKDFDERGFVFYTNRLSRKGKELESNPYAAICIYWMPVDRQVRIEGRIEIATSAEADAYFKTRRRGSQLGAWASKQSEILSTREVLMESHQSFDKQFGEKEVPRPPHWIGYRLVPEKIEFWEEQEFRLHNRLIFSHTKEGWKKQLLYP